MDPEFASVIFAAFGGPNHKPLIPPDPPPTDSPLKVWTGTEWAPAGVKVEG